ncbi:nuclear transport factor 2 family protein [Nonomuraea phyllanthi]|uniref:Nuclear transport factor 2 family protein n=2 Tax=Nonomuraea phyllanthi TaxID=2219224 RepID=A0A5C4WEU6_9ACTN|nr:nuclear transport factor 2 family protein [Nonomuraea phyllanthi]KAB8193261.1 nuclear transport factor 2 family protein [Nonomuraea phyllanthi]QFY10879.1 nuclear transport factor 2 family protein [Nonomuraea phyllanthi]
MMNLLDRYLAAWNETDPEARAKAVAELWTEDGTYTDPLADVSGHAAIAAVIEGARGMFPGMVFTPGELYDAHHHIARFTWHLGQEGAEPVVVGFDVVELAEDGRIRSVLGFLDKVPTA